MGFGSSSFSDFDDIFGSTTFDCDVSTLRIFRIKNTKDENRAKAKLLKNLKIQLDSSIIDTVISKVISDDILSLFKSNKNDIDVDAHELMSMIKENKCIREYKEIKVENLLLVFVNFDIYSTDIRNTFIKTGLGLNFNISYLISLSDASKLEEKTKLFSGELFGYALDNKLNNNKYKKGHKENKDIDLETKESVSEFLGSQEDRAISEVKDNNEDNNTVRHIDELK